MLKPSEKNPLGTALIFINQTRANISTTGYGGGGGDSTAGGKALKFYAYLRLQATCIRSERIKFKDPISKKEKNAPFGSHTQVKVVKSKVDAKQGQTADIFIRYGRGIDDLYTLIESGVAHKLVKKTGAFFELDGQKYQGRERLRVFLEADKRAREALHAAVLKSIRMQAEIDPETEAEMAMGEDEEVDALIASSFGAEDDDTAAGSPEEVELDVEDEG
jgi:recombination protein RecA